MTDVRKPHVDCERYHTMLYVTDRPAAIEFYTSRLGFTPDRQSRSNEWMFRFAWKSG